MYPINVYFPEEIKPAHQKEERSSAQLNVENSAREKSKDPEIRPLYSVVNKPPPPPHKTEKKRFWPFFRSKSHKVLFLNEFLFF